MLIKMTRMSRAISLNQTEQMLANVYHGQIESIKPETTSIFPESGKEKNDCDCEVRRTPADTQVLQNPAFY